MRTRGAYRSTSARVSRHLDFLVNVGRIFPGRRAKKGVFITTSAFTREARDYANQVSDSIVLVDGARLARLMIEHGVGVTHRPLKIAQVDSDYFENVP
ncbi:MAG: restriction endonuclease [Polyangiales bacterium]